MTVATNKHQQSHNKRLDVAAIKDAARGRWREVLINVGGFTEDELDGQHRPCPRCGGRDRFRWDNEKEFAICNQCFCDRNGDGIAAIQWLRGCDFQTAINAVAEYLGIGNQHNTQQPTESDAFEDQFHRWPEDQSNLAEQFAAFAATKPPITVDAIRAAGGIVVAWPKSNEHGRRCIAFPAFNRRDELTGYILRRVDGQEFSAIGKLQARKTHMLSGSRDGWVIPGGFDRVTQAEVVWRVEGIPDALALFPFLPPNQVVITNICGAKSSPQNLGILAGKTVYVVGDADVPGQEGAAKFATKALAIADRVKLISLPYEVSEDHGKDLRDYFIDGHTFSELLAVAEAAEGFVKPKRGRSSKWSDGQPTDPTPDELPDDVDEWTFLPAAKGRTDRANSRRFLKQYGDRVRFCFPWSKWLVWDGARWKIDDGGAVMRLAMATADTVWMDAKGCLSDDVVDFAVKTSGHGALNAMLKLAAADVSVAVDDMDANPWLLNCPNGTLDLRTGELRPHRHEDKLTKLCPTNFNPDAGSYHFDRFLEGVFDDGPTIAFLQRFFGYCLTGDVREQILAVFHGVGSNGKSTLLKAIEDTLGTDCSAAAPPSLLIEKKTETHPTELAGLFGKRLVIAQETNAGARLAEATVKILTGGDVISARRMREDFWTFAPTHKVVLVTNHRPRIVGNDHAIWRRLVLVPFARKFWNPDKGETGPAELRQDKMLVAKLKAEVEGILAWMVRGCLDWQRCGLQIPDSVRAATAEYRSEQDTLGRFVETCCIRSNMVRVKFADLFSVLETWCHEGGDNMPGRRSLSSWLKDSGFKEHTNNGRWYLGIALKAEFTTTERTEQRNEIPV